MSVITLISDWNLQDPYVAMFKGRLMQKMPDVQLLDITHQVEVLNINQAAFLLKGAYQSFPEGTVHIDMVGMTDSFDEDPIMMKWNNHYFVGLNNGTFSLMFFDHLTEIEIRKYKGNEERFFDKVIALSAACVENDWEACTEPFAEYQSKRPFEASYFAFRNHISGMVVYIDSQSNIVTNIPVSMFKEALKGGSFRARIGNVEVTKYHEKYVRDVEPFFIPNSLGMMEVATYGGRVALLARWQRDASVEIDFQPNKG